MSWSRPTLLGARSVLACLGTIVLADLLIWRWKAPYAVEALFDEPAHAATGLVALVAFGLVFEARTVLAVLAGSVLIDLDHVPRLFGSDVLQQGIPRPYTHSLGVIVALLGVALLLRGDSRRITQVAALALGLHLVRDMAEPGSPGVALLWPFSKHAFTIGYAWYGGVLVVLSVLALSRRRSA